MEGEFDFEMIRSFAENTPKTKAFTDGEKAMTEAWWYSDPAINTFMQGVCIYLANNPSPNCDFTDGLLSGDAPCIMEQTFCDIVGLSDLDLEAYD